LNSLAIHTIVIAVYFRSSARQFADHASRITFDGQPLDEVVNPRSSKDLDSGISLIRRI